MTAPQPTPQPSLRRRVLMALGYYDQQLHRGIVRCARESGWILDTSMAHYGVIPDHWQGDGILTVLLPHRRDLAQYVQRQRVPVVALSMDMPRLKAARVELDNYHIGQLAAEHLIERGFENLAFYRFSAICDVEDRERGFRETVQRAGLAYFALDWQAIASSQPRGRWFDWLKRSLRELPLPVGIMAQSDNRAVHLITACEAAGLAVPEQIAVVGVDNDEYACEFAPVPISSVDSNRESLAYAGAALLDQLMRGAPLPAEPQRIAPRGVIVRKSSDILAVEHKAVARALAFIWEHFREPIGVDDVIAASRVSRCGIYRAFQEHVGRSIGEELARKRVELAKRLLAEGDLKLHRVACLSGFSGGEHFSRAFTRIAGLTPSDYRRQHRPASGGAGQVDKTARK